MNRISQLNNVRQNTRSVKVGPYLLGGGNPVLIQSMLTEKAADFQSALAEIKILTEAGCQLVRVAVKDQRDIEGLNEIVSQSPLPVIADIHFDYRLALAALDAKVAKLRLNPGNLLRREQVEAVVEKAGQLKIPIRIGVNSGSVPESLIDKFGGPTVEALLETIFLHLKIFEELNFYDTVLSIKASGVSETIRCCRELARLTSYPLHLGVTEAGIEETARIRSAVALVPLLKSGIGDTIRVSVTGSVETECRIAREIVKLSGCLSYLN